MALPNSFTPKCPGCGKYMQMMDGKLCDPLRKQFAKDMFYVCTLHDTRIRCFPGTLKPMGRPADGTLRMEREWVSERMEKMIDLKVRRDRVPREDADKAAWKWLSKIAGKKVSFVEELDVNEMGEVVPALRKINI